MMSTVGARSAPDTAAALVLAHSRATGAAGLFKAEVVERRPPTLSLKPTNGALIDVVAPGNHALRLASLTPLDGFRTLV